ncbi:ankyrin repeat-containing domain protein [Aspergillus filifer]
MNGVNVTDTHAPCNPDLAPTEHSSCCSKKKNVCMTSGLCLSNTGLYWETGCTNATWTSDACPNLCPDLRGNWQGSATGDWSEGEEHDYWQDLAAQIEHVVAQLEVLLARFVPKEERPAFQTWLEDVKDLVDSRSSSNPDASRIKEINTLLNEEGSPVFIACVYGIIAILHTVEAEAACAGKEVDWDAKNAHGTPMLYIAARYGRNEIVRFLISRGANVDVTGGLLGNPLQAAAFYGSQSAVCSLLESEADLFTPGKFSGALDAAIEGGHEPVIMVLFEASGITEAGELKKVLLRASFDDLYAMVMKILPLLRTDEQEDDVESIHNTLQMALFQCRTLIAKRLLQKISDIRLKIGHFGNAMQSAAFGGHISMVNLVLEHGADVNSPGRFGTPLRAAALRGYDTVVCLLIDRGAKVDDDEANALRAAAFNGHASTVRLLLNSGLYNGIDYSPSVGAAVQAAAFRDHIEVVDMLVSTYGCKAAYTAFLAALNGGRERIVRLALKHDPQLREVNMRSKDRESATLREQLLAVVVRHGITVSQWYSSLLEIKVLTDTPSYERLAGKAAIGLAAENKWHRRSTNAFAREKKALWSELYRISKTSTEFAA